MLPRPQECNVEDGLSPSILPSHLIFKQSKSRIDIDIGKTLFILFHPPDLSHHAILLRSISDVHRGFVGFPSSKRSMTNEQICRVLETTEIILGQTSAGEERLSYKRLKMYKIFSSSLGIYSCQGIAEVAVLSSPHPCHPKSQLVSSASSCYIRL